MQRKLLHVLQLFEKVTCNLISADKLNKQSRISKQWNSSSEDQISVGRVHIQTMTAITAIHGRGQLTAVIFKAEKTGNWKLHLQPLQIILPFLSATDHFL